jgi:hypothetical protein
MQRAKDPFVTLTEGVYRLIQKGRGVRGGRSARGGESGPVRDVPARAPPDELGRTDHDGQAQAGIEMTEWTQIDRVVGDWDQPEVEPWERKLFSASEG